MELGTIQDCKRIRCPHYYHVMDTDGDMITGCEKGRMHVFGKFSCREFDIAAERREAGLS